MHNQNYTADSIEVLSGLDPIKKRPGMYTNTETPNHLVQEVVDNSVDEFLVGFASEISIIINTDHSIEVSDNGRGIPVDINKKENMSGVELIMSKIHSGGKFSNKNYEFSGGLHGVGLSVINALSSKVEIQIKRDRKIYRIAFENGFKAQDLEVIGKTTIKKTGTMIKFYPNELYFETLKLDTKALQKLFKAKALLCKGLKINYFDKNKNEKIVWEFNQDISKYLNQSEANNIPYKAFSILENTTDFCLECALAWNFENEYIRESYVNLIPTPQNGSHINGIKNGLYEAVRNYIDNNNFTRKIKITANDIIFNLSYIVSVKMKDPQFSGQTKEKLISRYCQTFVTTTVKDSFTIWLNQNKSLANEIIENIISSAKSRKRINKTTERKKIMYPIKLPSKLTDCLSNEVSKTELFLVEGDSAGGSAKQARNKNFQAILPLKGKILNSWEVDTNDLLKSKEIKDIITSVGVEPNSNDLSSLRYGKICILADADSDGLHITTLLCSLFFKHFQALIENGNIYVAQPPLFRVEIGKKVFYALDEYAKDKIIKSEAKSNSKVNTVRFKGLGEMNPGQLKDSTMNINSRKLVKLEISDNIFDDIEIMDKLMSKKRAKDRKVWLEDKGSLADV